MRHPRTKAALGLRTSSALAASALAAPCPATLPSSPCSSRAPSPAPWARPLKTLLTQHRQLRVPAGQLQGPAGREVGRVRQPVRAAGCRQAGAGGGAATRCARTTGHHAGWHGWKYGAGRVKGRVVPPAAAGGRGAGGWARRAQAGAAAVWLRWRGLS